MGAWLRQIRADIQKNTASMNRQQKAEYIFAYYWYHMLMLLIVFGLVILLVRHLFFGAPPKEFSCVMINQKVDYKRDSELALAFSKESGIEEKRILVDSDYVFSYDAVKLEAANESSYEKFFFQWSTGEVDAVLMPESFYQHCRELEYEFADLGMFLTEELRGQFGKALLHEDEREEAIYIEGTRLETYVEEESEDKIVLVFLPMLRHTEACQAFLMFAIGE